MDEEKIILFGPKDGKSLIRLYPELAAQKEFDLPSDDLLFVWYYSNQSSPIDPSLPEKTRAQMAAREAFKREYDKEKRQRFSELDFPEKIKTAISKMRKYMPEARAEAKRMLQTSFNKMQQMIDVDVEDFKYVDEKGQIQVNWTGRKQYFDMVHKMTETLPILLKQIEEGFGIDTIKPGHEKADNAISKYHRHKKDNL